MLITVCLGLVLFTLKKSYVTHLETLMFWPRPGLWTTQIRATRWGRAWSSQQRGWVQAKVVSKENHSTTCYILTCWEWCENSVLPSNKLYLGRRLRSKFYSSCFYFESRSLLTPSTWIFLFGWVVVLTSKCSSCIHDIKWRWIVANISKWLLTFE